MSFCGFPLSSLRWAPLGNPGPAFWPFWKQVPPFFLSCLGFVMMGKICCVPRIFQLRLSKPASQGSSHPCPVASHVETFFPAFAPLCFYWPLFSVPPFSFPFPWVPQKRCLQLMPSKGPFFLGCFVGLDRFVCR